MSNDSTTWWAPAPRSLRNPDLSPTDRSVFLALAWRMNWETGRCYPSLATIAEDANVSVSSAKRALANLEEHGYLTRHRRQAEGGGFTSTMYRLKIDGGLVHSEPRVGPQ